MKTTLQNYNSITISNSQEDFERPLFFEGLQKTHSKNKKTLYKMALSLDQVEKAQRVINCTNFLTYEFINNEFLRLKRINLCRERLCLNCQLANSRNLIKQLFWTIPRLNLSADDSLEFVTLTTQNCPGEKLKETIQHMIKRQNAFFRHYKIKDYFRSIEITHNEKENTYHPHLHILAIINKHSGFPFYDNKKGIEGANKLQKEWYTWLNIKNEYGYNLATSYAIKNTKAIFEVCKYCSKVEELEKIEVLKVLDNQLKSLRLKTPLGQFKTLAKQYKTECTSIKLQEMKMLEDAEIQLINMLYNKDSKKYEIKSIYNQEVTIRPNNEFWHKRRLAEEGKIY